MKISKYQACGNDFIIIADFTSRITPPKEDIIRICDRKFGIGADGLIIISSDDQADFSMDFYNSDGSGGMMCGNGGRCAVDFAFRSGIIPSAPSGHFSFNAPDGLHSGSVLKSNGKKSLINISLGDLSGVEETEVDDPLFERAAYKLNTGCDHLVLFLREEKPSLEETDVVSLGRKWRYDARFAPVGVNVNFASINADGTVSIRSYEKGVEEETLSCGTGVVASAISAHLKNDKSTEGYAEYTVHTRSGYDLKTSFTYKNGKVKSLHLEGETEQVFTTADYDFRIS